MPVEPASAADLPALARLMADSPLLRRYGMTIERAAAALEEALSSGDTLLLARSAPNTLPLGLAWLIHTRALAHGTYLRLLLVAESQQRQGLGRSLLQAAEESARSWGRHLYLLVTADNLPARRFYEQHGYRHVGDLRDLTTPGLHESLYFRVLDT